MSIRSYLTIAAMIAGTIAFEGKANAQVVTQVTPAGYSTSYYSPGVVTSSYYAPAASWSYYSSPAYYTTPYMSGYYPSPIVYSGYSYPAYSSYSSPYYANGFYGGGPRWGLGWRRW